MSATEILQAVAGNMVGAGDAAGVVLGVSLHGEHTVVAHGSALHDGSLAVTRETLWDLASVSKIVGTTSAIMALVSNGSLELDTRVAAIVPSFAGSGDTTVRELLQHRAGLWEWQPLYLAAGFTAGESASVYAAMDGLPLRYAPGTERHYSDLGFIYLGRIIEAVTGLPLAVAITRLVFEPLGMRNTGYRPVAGGASGVAVRDSGRPITASAHGDRAERAMVATGEPYPVLGPAAGARAAEFAWREREIVGEANDGNCFHALGGVAGHAGLFSTVDDLLTLAEGLGAAGSGDTNTPWTASLAREFFAVGPDSEQALGFRRAPIELDGESHTMLWHPGFTGCVLGFVPGQGLGIALAGNRLLTRDPAATPVATAQLWQPLLAAAAQLHSPDPTSSRTS